MDRREQSGEAGAGGLFGLFELVPGDFDELGLGAGQQLVRHLLKLGGKRVAGFGKGGDLRGVGAGVGIAGGAQGGELQRMGLTLAAGGFEIERGLAEIGEVAVAFGQRAVAFRLQRRGTAPADQPADKRADGEGKSDADDDRQAGIHAALSP